MPLIIDDFHYINKEIQAQIIRSLKEPIFEGLRVVLISVPHRSDDAVKVENEMTGRVQKLEIPLWLNEELEEIGIKGFPELNLTCDIELIKLFAIEAFGSPHLMQKFLLTLCKYNGINKAAELEMKIQPPPNLPIFFQKIVETTASKVAFEKLARGPRQRSDRVIRLFKDGNRGDIYLSILHGLAHTGPRSCLKYEEIRSAIKTFVLNDPIPQAHEITRVLSKMGDIAKTEMDGEPVIDWDKEDSILYLSDPYFSFYLKWVVRTKF